MLSAVPVQLREYRGGLPLLADWFAAPGAIEFSGGPNMISDIERDLSWARQRGDHDPTGAYLATLADETPAAFVMTGIDGYTWVNPFVVAPDLQGRGIGTEVLRQLVKLPELAGHELAA